MRKLFLEKICKDLEAVPVKKCKDIVGINVKICKRSCTTMILVLYAIIHLIM